MNKSSTNTAAAGAAARPFRLDDVPGYREALDEAKKRDARNREEAWLELPHHITGSLVLRTMTVRDYVVLDQWGSPFLTRTVPSLNELGVFLWVLSPAFKKWCDGAGLRKHFPTLQPVRAYLYGRRVRRVLRFRQLEKLAARHYETAVEPYEIPDEAAASRAIADCFIYIDAMLCDAPPAVARGKESGMCYLTAWFDSVCSEYNLTEDAFWSLPVPKLFSLLKAIRQRHNPDAPNFNRHRDALNAKIQRALSGGMTAAELLAGKLKLN